MYEAMMIAATGLQNQQRRLDTIADNVSNVNTVGFKSSRLDFKDALYTAGIVPALPRTPGGNQQKGHGLMVAGITKDFSTGNFQRTDGKLDFAIGGEGFFSIEAPGGDDLYTRNGSFNISVEIEGAFLVTNEGYYVQDTMGMRIRIPEFTESITVDENGVMAFVVGDEEVRIELGIFTFRNPTGLLSVGDGNYSESDASGQKLPANDIVVVQGMLEGSNVSLSEEMTRMIRTQRAFSLASRALTTADEMEGIANNMRR